MEVGILQLFWIFLFLAILAFNVIKRVSANKKKENTIKGRKTVDDEGYRKDKEIKPAKKIEWESIIGNIFGVEFDNPQLKRVRAPREEVEELEEAEHVDTEKRHDVVVDDDSMKAEISELHSSIEDRHIDTITGDTILDTTLKPEKESDSVYHVNVPENNYNKEAKIRKVIRNKILSKNDLKTAIIFSEIIGPPVSRRKRSGHGLPR